MATDLFFELVELHNLQLAMQSKVNLRIKFEVNGKINYKEAISQITYEMV